MRVYIDDDGGVWKVTSVGKQCTESAYVNTHYEALIVRDEWLLQQPQHDGGIEYEVVSVEDVTPPVLGHSPV